MIPTLRIRSRGRFRHVCKGTRHRPSRHPSAGNWRHPPPAEVAPAWPLRLPVWTDPVVDTLPIPGWKRVFDLLWVLLILPWILILGPILVCWIELMSPGPFLFRQTRIGRGGKPFTIYKFRTMKVASAATIHEDRVTRLIRTNQPMPKMDGEDDRLIRGACFIRMSGLDELPQVINVLRGEMSTVGPRPCVPCEFRLYDADHSRRFAVQPGVTGLWQIERTQTTTFREMVGMDLRYVDHLSPWSDLRIMAKTPVALIAQVATCVRSRVWKPTAWVTERSSA